MSSLQETMILFIGIITFIILRMLLLKLFKGQKRKLYEQAIKNGCMVDAYSIKEHHVIQDRNETEEKYRRARNRTVYLYEVNGKRYKKAITYMDSVNIYAASPSKITLYYDPVHPKKAVTEEEAFSAKHKIFITMVAFIIMILVINILLLLNSCDKRDDKPSSSETARYQAEKIISCIKQKDVEGLKELFSPYIQENHDLDAELLKLFEFIDGIIISYDAPWGSSASKSVEPSETKYELLVGHVANVKTNDGTNYQISFNSIYIDKANEDYIGVDFISISNQDLYNSESGYSEEVMVSEVLK